MQKEYKNSAGITKNYWIKLADGGTPDILACVAGLFIGIEVKKNAKEIEKWHKQREERDRAQRHQHLAIMKAGGSVILACSVDEVAKDIETIKINLRNGQPTK